MRQSVLHAKLSGRVTSLQTPKVLPDRVVASPFAPYVWTEKRGNDPVSLQLGKGVEPFHPPLPLIENSDGRIKKPPVVSDLPSLEGPSRTAVPPPSDQAPKPCRLWRTIKGRPEALFWLSGGLGRHRIEWNCQEATCSSGPRQQYKVATPWCC